MATDLVDQNKMLMRFRSCQGPANVLILQPQKLVCSERGFEAVPTSEGKSVDRLPMHEHDEKLYCFITLQLTSCLVWYCTLNLFKPSAVTLQSTFAKPVKQEASRSVGRSIDRTQWCLIQVTNSLDYDGLDLLTT